MKSNKRLYELIEDIVSFAEQELLHAIPEDEYRFLVDTLYDFNLMAITKYIKGAKEHGGRFLEDREHHSEARNEVIDLLFYLEAAKLKHNKAPKCKQ